MFSPEQQQIEICLLKSNLEEIENDLVVQRSAIPALDAENEQKYRETMSMLRVARSLNSEIERLKLENVRLTAKRMQLQRRCEQIDGAVERAQRTRRELDAQCKQEDRDIEIEIRKYEDALRDIADRFRNSRALYCEEDMKSELRIIEGVITDLKTEEQRRTDEVRELSNTLKNLRSDIPEDILIIVGKPELDNKLKRLSTECDTLQRQSDYVIKTRGHLRMF
ncbi:golgin subfamily A member 6-like protein 10 [Aricia agestis]|uniref:golgin subfamily A member 6-like protein 10 n=1 Tax=Aricia agestis TaxID=91739 RepID=UPI001C202F00|nr:golgin subfamily A member 6-like protein 10 [Aricia agestis]